MTSQGLPEDAGRAPTSELVRQRWRIVFRRTAEAAEDAQRDLEAAWLAALEASGLPLARLGPTSRRPKVAFGPPIPVGVVGEREILDLFLRDRLTLAEVRTRLEGIVPRGYELLDVHDVWVGGPSLPAAVVAVDYRVEVPAAAAHAPAIQTAIESLLAAPSLPRSRDRGGRLRAYDLRPFLLDLRVAAAPDDRLEIGMRLLADPAAGVGRPDEVLRALLEALREGEAREALRAAMEGSEPGGRGTGSLVVVRERLLTAEDAPRDPVPQGSSPDPSRRLCRMPRP